MNEQRHNHPERQLRIYPVENSGQEESFSREEEQSNLLSSEENDSVPNYRFTESETAGREETEEEVSQEEVSEEEEQERDNVAEPMTEPFSEPVAAAPGEGKRKVLVIAYYFPPMGLSGVLRITKFTRYLQEYGWQPTVLTVGDVGYYAHDYSLLSEVEEAGIEIVRTETLDPLRLFRKKKKIALPPDRSRRFMSGVTHTFLQPDNKIGWKRYALQKARELMQREQFDAILATAPPFTDFLIGLELQKEFGVPLVVDYRDPWLDNKNYFYATPFHKGYAFRLEHNVLKNADGVVVVNRRIKEKLISRYPFLTHETVHIIPSGYDPQEFDHAQPELVRTRKMRFTYSGLFDAKRTPRFFFEALARIFARHPETRDEIEMCFIGTFRESHRKMAAKLGVASALVTPGYVEHSRVIDYLLASDVLWLTIYDPSITPGKTYEYIGTRKPILALAPDGVVRNVLEGYGAATCVEPTKSEAIAEAIYEQYRQWKEGTLPQGNAALAKDYDQRSLTEQMARVLAYALKI